MSYTGVRDAPPLRTLISLDITNGWKLNEGAMLTLSDQEVLVGVNITGCYKLSRLRKSRVRHLLDDSDTFK